MVRLHQLCGQRLRASDGEIGKVEDFCFEDTSWCIRYLVVNTGNWLIGRKVLLSPAAITVSGHAEYSIVADLTRDQIEHSPGISEHLPVSRQHEEELATYYQWSYLWSSRMVEGASAAVPLQHARMSAAQGQQSDTLTDSRDIHLRSVKEICGYRVLGRDKVVGYVEDVLADFGSGQICCLLIGQRLMLPSKRFLAFPGEILKIHWASSEIETSTSAADFVKYDPDAMLRRGA